MPNRILRDGINSSARVNRLSPDAEVLYRRLHSVADDYGRYYANPATIRGACWPTHPSPPCEQVVDKLLAECQQGERPLITVYEVGGCKYLQVTDFGQKIRSKSKFPAPADKLSTDCEQVVDNMPALGGGDMRIAKAESETGAKPARAPATAVPRWKSDDAFARFAADYLATGGAFIDDDFQDAYQFCWRGLNFEEKLERANALNRHAEEYHAEPRFVPKPRKFLETEWQRPPKPPRVARINARRSTADVIEERLAKGEKPW